MIRGTKKIFKQASNKIKFWFQGKTLDNYFTLKNPHHHDQINEIERSTEGNTKYWIQITLYYLLEYLIPLLCLALIFSVLFSGIPTYSVPYFSLDDPELSYPIIFNSSGGVYDNLPLWFVAVVLVFAIPVCTFVLFHLLFVRNLPDFHHAILGYIQTIALAMAMVAFGWLCYGSYRPTFLQECQPDTSKSESTISDKAPLQKFVNILKYFKPNQICKDPSRFTLGSPSATPGFPSGHIASVMSVWVFFLLYYAAKANVSFIFKIYIVTFIKDMEQKKRTILQSHPILPPISGTSLGGYDENCNE